MPAISFRGVTMDYGAPGTHRSAPRTRSSPALGHVDLDITDGEFVTVVGPSGCGKSTLMNIAAGLLSATAGAVTVDGEPVSGPDPERGVIFQQYALFPWMTVAANVEYGLKVAGVSRPERRRRAREALALVELTEAADALPKTLSGGMKQRCAIARAYAVDPKVLLLDEPFGALDSLTRVRMQDSLLGIFRRDRRTALFITHDIDEAVRLGDRVVVMAARPGRIQEIIDVDLPADRDEELVLSSRFAALRSRVWSAVHQHSADGRGTR